MFCRINLHKTNYSKYHSVTVLENINIGILKTIYYAYCEHKQFKSIMPFIKEQYLSINSEVLGYYDADKLVAYSLIYKYPSINSVVSEQFVWDYKKPSLRLGINSLKNECAFYKKLGYDYLYLGEPSPYKEKFSGYEVVSNLHETT